ncbi:hypothetical protein Taro_025303 [Colocasia esculenta]|uniref:Uncharacterized protein n=1 Tax=Colocasia esculenta TaxID=4460 RepID=A0A843V9U7_COLES|nr:hypothetical protein [Colocasia esculenta]
MAVPQSRPAQIVRGREQKPMAIATAPFSYCSPSLLLLLCLLLSEGIGRSDSMLGYAKLQMWPSCVLVFRYLIQKLGRVGVEQVGWSAEGEQEDVKCSILDYDIHGCQYVAL